MTDRPFDALAAASRLSKIGMDRDQAEAVAEVAQTAANSDRENLVTKTEMQAALAQLETRLTWRIVGVGGAVIAAVALIT